MRTCARLQASWASEAPAGNAGLRALLLDVAARAAKAARLKSPPPKRALFAAHRARVGPRHEDALRLPRQ